MPERPIKVTVSDPDTGEVLETQILDNDFLVLCAGAPYISGIQHYPRTGTQILTIKRRTPTGATR